MSKKKGKNSNYKQYVEIRLNEDMGKPVIPHGYELDATKKYVIDYEKERDEQLQFIFPAIQIMGLEAMSDWHNWLEKNGFDADFPNPTNEFVSKYYGKEPLWKTELSQGIVVKNKDKKDEDYYIVMECSRLNEGFKYTRVLVTLGGCI